MVPIDVDYAEEVVMEVVMAHAIAFVIALLMPRYQIGKSGKEELHYTSGVV